MTTESMFHHLRRPLIALLALLGVTLPALSQQITDGSTGSVLWRVDGEKGKVYLLGSVHVLPEDAYPLAPEIERAYDSSETLVFELPLDTESQLGMSVALMKHGMYKGKETFKGNVSEETYALAAERLKALGLDINLFAKMKPWVVGMMVMGVGMQSSGFEPQYGVELHFQQRANEDGKPILGLESVEDQIAIFDGMPPDAQEAFLREQLADDTTGMQKLRSLVEAWKAGDIGELERQGLEGLLNDSAAYEALVVRRNNNWIAPIERYLEAETTHLVIVGSMHLLGPDGVVELLRRRGYRVERL